MPESKPVPGAIEIPIGNVPETLQLTGVMAFECMNATEYGALALPDGMVAGFTVIVWQFTTSVYWRLPTQPLPAVAVMVIGKLPVWSGVPNRVRVVALKVSPAGRVPLSTQFIAPAPPVWLKICEYGAPAVA